MTEKSTGQIVVGSNGDNPVLCFSVEPGTGTSGTQKQFVDIEVTPEQLNDLTQVLKNRQEAEEEES